MLRFAALCFVALATTTARFVNNETPPEWGLMYYVKGVFSLPLKDVQVPFEAWYNLQNRKERMDFYGGAASALIRLPSKSGPGLMRKVFYYTSETELNKLKCMDHSLSPEKDVTDSALPNMTHYKFMGTETMHDVEVSKWQLEITKHDDDMREEYFMWITYGKDNQPIPLKFEKNEYNIERGIHSDQYYLEFTDYRTKVIEDSIFEIDQGMECDVQDDDMPLYMNPLQAFLRMENSAPAEHHFERFKQMHGRQYGSDAEHQERLDIFRENLRYINEHNSGKSSFKMAVNHLADRTDEELAGLFGGRRSTAPQKQGLLFPYDTDTTKPEELTRNIPDQYDWRLHGAVTPVKDQSTCGSCWAFASVGVVESALFIHGKSEQLMRLSEQALIDCSWMTDGDYFIGNLGCGGGYAVSSFEWVAEHGLPTYEAYGGYLAENGMCHIDNVTSTAFIRDWRPVHPRDENALRLAIFKHGPVAVAFFSNTRSFMFYSSGVYHDQYQECPDFKSDHFVLAVGYGELHGERYLLIKNSWGPQWGMNGYFLIATKHNTCGIMDEPSFVIV